MEISTILSITLTAGVSALSLAVSILTVIFNNKHQRQIKILDIIYDKKYKTYQEFFEIYSNYYITKEYDKAILSKSISNCLLISNKKTTRWLEILFRDIIKKTNIHINETDLNFLNSGINRCFENCINSMKEELNLS